MKAIPPAAGSSPEHAGAGVQLSFTRQVDIVLSSRQEHGLETGISIQMAVQLYDG